MYVAVLVVLFDVTRWLMLVFVFDRFAYLVLGMLIVVQLLWWLDCAWFMLC